MALLSLAPASSFGQARGVVAMWTGELPGAELAFVSDGNSVPALTATPALPRMGPEVALTSFQQRSATQATSLEATSDTTVIVAELPDTSQRGEYELRRYYSAPRSLSFSPQHFEGDGFVKSNVIVRLLQSEVDHVEKQEGPATAITPANYKFSYKGVEMVDGEVTHVFQVKPRHKRPGLFKGRIYLNAYTGSLRRAEGTLVKSPSLLIKKVEFVQEFGDFGVFTFPVHLHSISRTRIVGRAIVDIFHRNYTAKGVPTVQAASERAPSGQGSN